MNACQICGKESFELWRVIQGKKLFRCQNCDFFSFDKADYILDECRNQYLHNETSSTHYYTQSESEDKFNFHRRLALIEKKLPLKGSILDVGCSVGHFLEVAKQRGWNAEGIEPNPKAAYLAREKGFTVYQSFLNQSFVSKMEKKFDVIHLGDVIEHVFNPAEMIQDTSQLLRKDGYLMMITPDFDSCLVRWLQIKPREHLVYFTRKSLGRLVNSQGFEILVNCRWSRYRSIEHMDQSTTFSAKSKVWLSYIRNLGLSKLIAAFLYYFTRDEILLISRKRI